MVMVKVYKKSSETGELYLYLDQRDYISTEGVIDDINGIAYVLHRYSRIFGVDATPKGLGDAPIRIYQELIVANLKLRVFFLGLWGA